MKKLVAVAVGVVTAAVLLGCASPRDGSVGRQLTLVDCPEDVSSQVALSVSVVPVPVPADLIVKDDAATAYGLIGRRILVSVAPMAGSRGVQVFSSELTIAPVGGMFDDWAAVGESASPVRRHDDGTDDSHAVDVIPGRMRVRPFLRSSTLQSQTSALTLLVTPGGVAIDERTVTTAPMWTADRHPIAPERLQVDLTAVRHMTVFDIVYGNVKLDFVAAKSRSAKDRWECSVEQRVTLVERDAVLPALWDLHTVARNGKPRQWLAFFDPAVGLTRAIFRDPDVARGFAAWLRETNATRVGKYQLGVFQPDDAARDTTSPIPADRSLADTFRAVSADELGALTVGRLGEL